MWKYEFTAHAENGVIKLPEELIQKVEGNVTVTVEGPENSEPNGAAILRAVKPLIDALPPRVKKDPHELDPLEWQRQIRSEWDREL